MVDRQSSVSWVLVQRNGLYIRLYAHQSSVGWVKADMHASAETQLTFDWYSINTWPTANQYMVLLHTSFFQLFNINFIFFINFAIFLLAVWVWWLSSVFQEKQSANQTHLCSHKWISIQVCYDGWTMLWNLNAVTCSCIYFKHVTDIWLNHYLGSKNFSYMYLPFGSLGQVDFPSGQVTFHFHLSGKGPGKLLHLLSLAQGKQTLKAPCPKDRLELEFLLNFAY